MERSIQTQLARTAIGLTLISLLGKILGFVREQVIASKYGATRITDAYLAAFALPQLLLALVSEPVSTAMVPILSQYKSSGDEGEGWKLAGTICRLVLAVLVTLSLLMFLGAPIIVRFVAPGFDLEDQMIMAQMLRIMSPTLLFLGVAAVFSALLQACRQFAAPGFAPHMVNAGIIGVLLLFRQLGSMTLAWGTLLGSFLSVAFLGWHLKRLQVPLFRESTLAHSGIGMVGRLAGPISIGSLSGELRGVIERMLASGLDAGSIAAMNYAAKLVQLPARIFVNSLSTVMYPTWADRAAQRSYDDLRHGVRLGILLISSLMIPAAVGLIILRVPIVSLVYERGSFDKEALAKTTWPLVFYAIGLLGLASDQILGRAFYVLGDSSTPVMVGVGTSLLNIILAVGLVRPLQHGGLALANSAAFLVNMALLVTLLQRKLGASLHLTAPMAKIAIAASLMGFAVTVCYPTLRAIGRIAGLAGSIALGIAVYVTLLGLLGVEELKLMSSLRRGRI